MLVSVLVLYAVLAAGLTGAVPNPRPRCRLLRSLLNRSQLFVGHLFLNACSSSSTTSVLCSRHSVAHELQPPKSLSAGYSGKFSTAQRSASISSLRDGLC